MNADEFLDYLERGEIPPRPPAVCTKRGRFDPNLSFDIDYFSARQTATELGMWAVVDQVWTAQLAAWIGGRKVLEIMSGVGWLAKALAEEGVDIIATDSGAWASGAHKNAPAIHPIHRLEALEAVAAYPEREVLIVSWPPCGEEAVVEACRAWGQERPIVYIGEGQGGCNAPDNFFDHFWELADAPSFDLMAWPGLHDDVMIGHWREQP